MGPAPLREYAKPRRVGWAWAIGVLVGFFVLGAVLRLTGVVATP